MNLNIKLKITDIIIHSKLKGADIIIKRQRLKIKELYSKACHESHFVFMGWIVCLVCVHQIRNHAEPIFPLPQVIVFLFSRQFPYQMMFMSFNSSTTGITSEMEQELLTIPENLSSLPIFCLVRVVSSLVFCVVLCRSLFVLLLTIIFSAFRFTASDYHFGIYQITLGISKCKKQIL